MTPFHIDGPALVSFSGGRTSGYMLRRILDEGLQPDVHVVFADTGKERAETYAFVEACAQQWQVIIHHVERPGGFTQLITDRSCLPNPVQRFCTQELKIRPMRDWMRARGYDHWTSIVGIRADEPRRVARLREATESRHERWDIALPLADAGITEADVMAFWAAQSFDLHLRQSEGNCDLCFLKGSRKRQQIMRDRPDLAVWWIEQERRMGDVFRRGSPSYAALASQGDLFTARDESLTECYCHD
ncbi:MAG TPA: phosphoadenosine phosphosulfate reductase family protein [Xanthobacteraceae bacterium]|nr:phosphoadenosine phosphosulfate reductase family protein [Xanthobacteraceae bacterium]